MRIQRANSKQFQPVRAFYHAVIDGVGDSTDSVGWKKDIYPSPDFLKNSIGNGELYIAAEGETIVGAFVLNHQYNSEYRTVQWPTKAEDAEITVIHALGVHPAHTGKGIAKQMVQFAVDFARERVGVPFAVGRDKLYTGMGIQYLHTLPMFYEDTGWTEFQLYEYRL